MQLTDNKSKYKVSKDSKDDKNQNNKRRRNDDGRNQKVD
jgi:hypothetical protein